MTGVELLDSTSSPVPLSPSHITLLDSEYDNTTVEKLVNGHNIVTSSHQMWSTKFDGNLVRLQLNLNQTHQLSGIRIWNYNEDSYTGVSLRPIP